MDEVKTIRTEEFKTVIGGDNEGATYGICPLCGYVFDIKNPELLKFAIKIHNSGFHGARI